MEDDGLMSLHSSFPGSVLSRVLRANNDEDVLAQSCSARFERNLVDSNDDELTNLGWLQSSDLLRNMNMSQTKVPVANKDTKSEQSDNKISSTFSTNAHTIVSYEQFLHLDSKPPFSFSTLIFMAIDRANGKKLSVKEIYEWIWENFPYYQSAQTGWKNSVRHNLSLNKCFRKVGKDKEGNHGKGSMWTIDPEYRAALLDSIFKAVTTAQSQSGPSATSHNGNTSMKCTSGDEYPSEIEVATALLSMKHSTYSVDTRSQPAQPVRSSSPMCRLPNCSTKLDHSYSRCRRGVASSSGVSSSGSYDGFDTDDTEPFGDDADECKVDVADALMHLAHTLTPAAQCLIQTQLSSSSSGLCEMEGVDYMVSCRIVGSEEVKSDRVGIEDVPTVDPDVDVYSVGSEVMDDSGIGAMGQKDPGDVEVHGWGDEDSRSWQSDCYKRSPPPSSLFTTSVAF